jgi:hypothetical protein
VKQFAEDFLTERLEYLNANCSRELFYAGTSAYFLTSLTQANIGKMMSNNDGLSLPNGTETLFDGRWTLLTVSAEPLLPFLFMFAESLMELRLQQCCFICRKS